MVEGRFDGKCVMITGAGGGIGKETARQFAEAGALLALSDLDGNALESAVSELSATGATVWAETLDVSAESNVKRHVDQIVERFGRLDVAFNNAGVAHSLKPLPELDVTDLERVLSVNVRGVFLGLKYQIPAMQRAGGGAIINMASAAGLVGAGQLSAYSASKHAVVGLTKSAADENGRSGVRINCVCPSFAATKMYDSLSQEVSQRKKMQSPQTDAAFTKRSPMGRVITAAEVAQTVLWLADAANTAVHGQAIAIDGGLTSV